MKHLRFRSERLRRRDDRGYAMIMTAMLLIPLLAVAGLAVDLGGWYSHGSKQQRAADAAALAGVVWLPNLTAATNVAKAVAKENGYDDADPDVSVTVAAISTTELKVTIVDTNVPVFIERFWTDKITITRDAVGEYVLPVPLGSPKNYFGTGNMSSADSDFETENFFGALNGYCWGKHQGGPFEARWKHSLSTNGNACSATHTSNPEYIETGNQYEYYIDVPSGRTDPIVVHLWNPGYYRSGPSSVDDPSPTYDDTTTTFELRSADGTPLDDTDNPIYACAGAGETNPRTFDGALTNDATLLGRAGWAQYCTISPTAPSGKYILGIRNLDGASGQEGSQYYSVMASYNGTGGVCDKRTDASCPRVYGKQWMSIGLNNAGPSPARFYLSEILPEHAGKVVEITLFDPGEGASSIRILQPDGSYATFRYQDMGQDGITPGTLSSNTTSLSVGSGTYNGKYVKLSVQLPTDYNTKYTQWWWKIQYNYSSSGVTDRTTWGVRVIGDPVHLEE